MWNTLWPAGAPQKMGTGNYPRDETQLGPMHAGYHDIDACPTAEDMRRLLDGFAACLGEVLTSFFDRGIGQEGVVLRHRQCRLAVDSHEDRIRFGRDREAARR